MIDTLLKYAAAEGLFALLLVVALVYFARTTWQREEKQRDESVAREERLMAYHKEREERLMLYNKEIVTELAKLADKLGVVDNKVTQMQTQIENLTAEVRH